MSGDSNEGLWINMLIQSPPRVSKLRIPKFSLTQAVMVNSLPAAILTAFGKLQNFRVGKIMFLCLTNEITNCKKRENDFSK